MYIQSYQIHNVLNVYRRQLSQTRSDQVGQSDPTRSAPDPVTISTEGKSQSIMEKVADNVIKKITTLAPGSDFERELSAQVKSRNERIGFTAKDQSFVFNTIGGNNQKETRSIAVDDSQGLMNRLNELAQAAVNRNAE